MSALAEFLRVLLHPDEVPPRVRQAERELEPRIEDLERLAREALARRANGGEGEK